MPVVASALHAMIHIAKKKMSALTQIPLVQLTQVSILNQSVSLGGI